MNKQAQQGFALVEALVALLILSVGILALAQLQARITQHSALARQQVQATAWAQERVERWRAGAELQASAPEQRFEAIVNGQDSPAGDAATYERRWQVSSLAAAKAVAVQVQWSDREGRDQSVLLRSLIAPNDALRTALLMSPLSPAQTQLGAEGRPTAIPPQAMPIAGSSRWHRLQLPLPADGGAWLVFDARSGDVAYRCGSAPSSEAALSACVAMAARLISGTAQLDSGISLTATTLALADASTAPCAQEPVSGLSRAVIFVCLAPVQDHDRSSRTLPVWSGRLQFAARSGAGEPVRVCRYAHNASQADGRYVDVDRPLLHQNHVLTAEACPAGTTQQL